MKRSYKLGIIGCGRALNMHMPGLLDAVNKGLINLVAACDIREEALKSLSQKYNIEKGYTDINQLFKSESLDLVFICTPPETHKDQLKISLHNNVHVILEKPAASSLGDMDYMIRISEKYDKKVLVGENYRWFTDSAIVLEAIERGYIGDPLWTKITFRSPEFRGFRFKDPSHSKWMSKAPHQIFLEQAVHWLDLFQHWLREDPKEVYAIFPRPKHWEEESNPDYLSLVQIRYANGKSALLEQNYISHIPGFFYEATVMGEKGTIRIEWNLQQRDSATVEIFSDKIREPNGDPNFASVPRDWNQKIDLTKWSQGYVGGWTLETRCFRGTGPFRRGSTESIIHDFIDCIEKDQLPLTNLMEEEKVLKVLYGAYQSADLAKSVKIG